MTSTQRQELLAVFENAQAEFEALLEQVGEARLTEPGVTGSWSIKDIIAHVTAWEERPVAWLEALQQGTSPEPAPWPKGLDDDQTNALIYEANRDRSLADVLARWRQVSRSIAQAIRTLSEDDLFNRQIEWLGGNSLAEALPGNSYEHLNDHAALIREWLAAQQDMAAA
jgi:hypothetical protein